MNKFIGIGRVTKDLELRRTPTNKAVTTFSIAIDDGYGEKKTTDYIDIVVWDKLAENCARFIGKGSKIAVVGKVKKRSYESKDGHKNWVTEVVAQEVEFLESKGASGGQQPAQYSGPYAAEVPVDDSDLPF